ncbi:MAG: dienelactone hydrolase family protein, partial [Chloroflexi bacterium]|nr:dienelactone hydrolase family protein [Chloroflexota bacterium]
QSSPQVATAVTAVPLDQTTMDALYQRSFLSKLAHLETLHTAARQGLQQRYALTEITPEQYRQRVAESLDRTAGPALPETTDRRVQTRCILRRPAYDLYEVVLESVPGVEVAGYLLVPPNPQPAPAIICQHGLGGRPDGLVGFEDRFEGLWVYDRFPQRLAEKGYVTFVPFMNWGWPQTGTRDQLVKLAYALGFAPNRFEVAQLHAIVDFLQARPEVISDRIAFYGLSYGGHASLWLCGHEPRLAAVLTAGHFNDWQTKLTSLELSPPLVRPTSFVSVDEGYDMFNYNILNELGHAELVTRFAPRPHFIENGLQDSVTPTAWVDREFARVQAVFDWLGAGDQTELEHFAGPHRVWSEGSFRFLHRHLRG